jgi:hypothetical protein
VTDIELAAQLRDALPGRIGAWVKEIASAAMATAPADIGPLLWALVLSAIMDRESGGGRYLIPVGPAGVGDHGHGRGLMQIDDRDRPPFPGRAAFVRGASWMDPAKNILFGARILAAYYDRASGHLGRAMRRTTRDQSRSRPRTQTNTPPVGTTPATYWPASITFLSRSARRRSPSPRRLARGREGLIPCRVPALGNLACPLVQSPVQSVS